MDRFNYGQNAGWNNLAQYANMVNGLPVDPTTSQTARTPGGSRLAGGLGGAMSGASAGSMFGPVGTGIGGAIGGLAGLFG